MTSANELTKRLRESIAEARDLVAARDVPSAAVAPKLDALLDMVARLEELTQAGEAAASDEERLRFILSNARIVVCEIDRDLRFKWVYDPRHLPDEAVVGQSVREFAPAFAEHLAGIVERVIRTGVGERIELSPPPLSSRQEHLLVAFEPTRDEKGEVRGVLLASTEITDLKETQIALAQSVSFRERMLAVMAHDLRNPLSSIVGLARLYGRKDDVEPNLRRAFLQVERASGRMVELIGTLLDFSAARFGESLPVRRAACDLRDVVSAVVDEIRSGGPERVINLRVDGDARGSWDGARMAQVVSNLVGNALTHGLAGGPVHVDIEGTDSRVLLRVTNWGATIAPEDLPLLFEPFRRGAGARAGGLGLGLYIVREIVRSHDGVIRVESGPESGTIFSVDLPRTLGNACETA
jgi:signal transduction histidine kinase